MGGLIDADQLQSEPKKYIHGGPGPGPQYVDYMAIAKQLSATTKDNDPVNHPQHYGGDVPHETWKCLNAWGLEKDALLWNAVKYISRAGKKDSLIQDLKKALWYLQKRIALLEGEKGAINQ